VIYYGGYRTGTGTGGIEHRIGYSLNGVLTQTHVSDLWGNKIDLTPWHSSGKWQHTSNFFAVERDAGVIRLWHWSNCYKFTSSAPTYPGEWRQAGPDFDSVFDEASPLQFYHYLRVNGTSQADTNRLGIDNFTVPIKPN